jgi:hypothetical protein
MDSIKDKFLIVKVDREGRNYWGLCNTEGWGMAVFLVRGNAEYSLERILNNTLAFDDLHVRKLTVKDVIRYYRTGVMVLGWQ